VVGRVMSWALRDMPRSMAALLLLLLLLASTSAYHFLHCLVWCDVAGADRAVRSVWRWWRWVGHNHTLTPVLLAHASASASSLVVVVQVVIHLGHVASPGHAGAG
jgi:hypothetical protein